MADPAMVLGACVLEALVGYPDNLHRRISHPVALIAASINAFEVRWNRPHLPQRALGIAAVALTAGAAAAVGGAISLGGAIFIVIAGTLGLAQRSLYLHVRRVLTPLRAGDLPAARAAVGQIVGRDTDALDASGVAAAALESLAESFNDGVVAPVFWFAVAGLPGLFAYKAVNTADSLIGHMEPRHRLFGWAAARTDDVMNLIPARLAGVLIVAVGRGGGRCMVRDAPKHASPNAGWPEAAMAGALGVQLGGPASYDGVLHERPIFGEGAPPDAAAVARGLRLYLAACGLMWLMLALGGLLWRQ